jgi:hypothetical protein
VASAAQANAGGVAGYTGKPNATAPQGESCNRCHNGGATPQVRIDGPASLMAGQSGEYTLVVTTGQSRAGAGVATSAGTLAPIAGLRDSFGEMVQNNAATVTGGAAQFRFRLTAPTTGNAIKLYAVGLAANGAGTGGDSAAQITRDITVSAGMPPPSGGDAGTTPPPGSSSSSSSSSSGGADPDPAGNPDGGTSANKTSKNGGKGTNNAADGEDDEEEGELEDEYGLSRRRPGSVSPQPQGCSTSPSKDLGDSWPILLGGVGAAIALGWRRRKGTP